MTEGETLLALAEVDLAILRATRELEELPEKRAILALRHRLAEIETLAEKARAYASSVERHLGQATDEMELLEAKIETERVKVVSGSVTNPKELQNLTREIDALLRKKSSLENETLSLMEKSETASAQLAKIEATLAEGREKESALVDRFRQKGGHLQTEIERLRGERAKLAAALSQPLLARYEALREAKHGIGAGVLKGDICGACRTELPAERAQAIQMGPEIAECPNCRRILVVLRGTGS